MDKLAPNLEFVVLQTGAKMYGCHLLDNHPTDYMPRPLKESTPRLKPPYHDQLFYHLQLDWITEYAKDKSWNWCDTVSPVSKERSPFPLHHLKYHHEPC